MNLITDINTSPNGVVMSVFEPTGSVLVKKIVYPKSQVAYIDYSVLGEIWAITLTANSPNFAKAQTICIAKKDAPSNIQESTLLLVRNWNGSEVQTTNELFDLISNFSIS